MQANNKSYTGYNDKTGREISDGDIMDSNDSGLSSIIGLVEFRKGKWVLGQTRGREDDLKDAIECGYTVIGNVNDNPEMLRIEESEDFDY